jgi:hypothetical protein
METNNIEELARIASGLKLADDYETALAAQPENIRSSTRMQKIIAFLKDNGSATLKDIAMALYGRPDTASVNQLVKALKQAGIIADTGLVAPKVEKSAVNAPGVKGRPKVTNDEIKMLGGGALRKFAKGQTDFTPEEIDFITQLYNAATAISEAEIAEVSKNEIDETMISPDNRVDHLAHTLENVWIMGTGRNPIDFQSMAQSLVNDMFDEPSVEEINESRWNKLAGLI